MYIRHLELKQQEFFELCDIIPLILNDYPLKQQDRITGLSNDNDVILCHCCKGLQEGINPGINSKETKEMIPEVRMCCWQQLSDDALKCNQKLSTFFLKNIWVEPFLSL